MLDEKENDNNVLREPMNNYTQKYKVLYSHCRDIHRWGLCHKSFSTMNLLEMSIASDNFTK